MAKMIFWVIPCLFFISYCRAEGELVAVTVLVRHGSRLPENFYRNDPYQNLTWPFVLGDLTNEGIDEMYDVGTFLKDRYKNFLSPTYSPSEVYAQSLDYDRCIMTGGATLAGLFPPSPNDNWNPDILWQPVPLHITPTWQDIVIDMKACNKRQEVSGIIRGTKTYEKIMAKDQDFFDFLGEKSGETINFSTMYPLFDTLFSELKMNMTLPDWAQESWPKMLQYVIKYTKMNSIVKPERQIQIGPILSRILSQFDRAIGNYEFNSTDHIYRKFMAYFGTEWLFFNLTYALGLPGIGIPEFGAIYLIELRKKHGEYFVNILYRNSASKTEKTIPVSLKRRNFNLKYENFKKTVSPYVVNASEWARLCRDFTNTHVRLNTLVPMS